VRRFLSIVSLTLLLLGLASCTPSVTGTTPSTALDTGTTGLRPVEVTPGSTWYVSNTGFDPEAFGITSRESDRRFGDDFRREPRSGRKHTAVAIPLFRVNEVSAPDGWNIRLHSATLERIITDVGSSSFRFSEEVNFIFAATVPEGTPAGSYTAIVKLRGADGEEKPFVMFFTVPKTLTAS
jgi:hypothetical protein